MKVRRETLAVLIASEALLAAMGAMAAGGGMRYPGTAAAMGALVMALPYVLERAGWVRLPVFVQAWASMAIGLHTFGLVWGLYDGTWWWDELTHLVSSALVGMMAAMALHLFDLHSLKIKVPRWAYPLLIVTFSIFIGVVWEVAEFAGDVLAGTRMQYSLLDTLSDCYVDMLGGVAASLLWVAWFWRDPTGEIGEVAQGTLISRLQSLF